MAHDLIGFALNADEEEDHLATERALGANEELRLSLEQVRGNLAPLQLMTENDEIPPGLANRTIARIRMVDEPMRPSAGWEWGSAPARRRLEAAVALVMMMALGGLSVLGLDRMIQRSAQTACAQNLRGFHQAFESYAANHSGQYPGWRVDRGRVRAGTFYAELSGSGHLPREVTPACSSVHAPRALGPIPTAVDLDYCYTLGYRDASGTVRPLQRRDDANIDRVAVLADRPLNSWVDRYSVANHLTGAHVLFASGQVVFVVSPRVGHGGDHIFENADCRVAAGKSIHDSVLGEKDDSP